MLCTGNNMYDMIGDAQGAAGASPGTGGSRCGTRRAPLLDRSRRC